MKGVILAGGLGTRLYPLTWATNKHLLPVYNRPMIFYPIETLTQAGIDEIIVIASGPHSGHFISVLKNGKELGIKHLEYAYQEKPNGGIADALAIAEDFADSNNIAVILGDNTTDTDISHDVKTFTSGAKIFLKEVPDPERFGVAVLENNKIKEIVEKPKTPTSNFAITGLYLYDNTVFDKIRAIEPSARGELEITDVNSLYLQENKLDWSPLKGYWSDAGTFNTLYQANEYWYNKNK